VERHTYFHIPVAYHTDRIIQATLLIRRVDGDRGFQGECSAG